jgi:hypothetical protein
MPSSKIERENVIEMPLRQQHLPLLAQRQVLPLMRKNMRMTSMTQLLCNQQLL